MSHLNAIRNRHFLLIDLLLLPLLPALALALRLDGFARLPEYAGPLLRFTSLAVVVKLVIFVLFGLYRRYWRYASIEELALILKLVAAAGVVVIGLFFLARPLMAPLPRSLPFLDALLTVGAVAGPRFLVRLLARRLARHRGDAQRVLIVGAGDAGQLLAREMHQNPRLGLDLAGFVDDDPEKQGLHLHGVRILGGREKIPDIVREYRVQQVIIAMPSASGRTVRELLAICKETGVKTSILPGFAELLNGDVSLRRLRPVQINDLLRRAPIETDTAAVRELIQGKRVLVTGAGGSIGSELCRQIWRFGPAELVLLGHGENSIFDSYHELHKDGFRNPQSPISNPQSPISNPQSPIRPVIADIRFPDRVRAIFEQHRPQIVFHAAAHKHVPLMEANPAEAITNNVLGTRNVLEAALAVDVERFVMISTDKAVNPTSIMGASKRAAELLVHRAAKTSGKPYVAVRFGNVLGSRGSVVLTFQRQIAAGGPVTVTHPEMRRYFMTIPEAVQLVLQASVHATEGSPGAERSGGTGGEVFVLDMGEPIKIVDLARDLIELSGLRVGEDIEIEFTGMRPGEKLYEELFIEGEHYQRTRHEKIFIAANASTFVPSDLDQAIEALEVAARRGDRDAILLALRHLIPEFQPVGESMVGTGQEEAVDGPASSSPRTETLRPQPVV